MKKGKKGKIKESVKKQAQKPNRGHQVDAGRKEETPTVEVLTHELQDMTLEDQQEEKVNILDTFHSPHFAASCCSGC